MAGWTETDDSDRTEWKAFEGRFLQADGRIIDTGNQGVSHTEGQGWGLLFAEYFGDEQAFNTIWSWTARNLRRPSDALHSWRYDPGSSTPISDVNNATDGDLFIGMALSRAARRWGNDVFAGSAAAIAHDVLRLLVRTIGARTVLLPAAQGFETRTDVVLNPSYYVFPAMRELATRASNPLWEQLQGDGLTLMEEGRFGRWKLPPDWLQIDRSSGRLTPAPNWPPRFSYDAVRVPLYLTWAGLPLGTGFLGFIQEFQTGAPAWVNLLTNATAPFAAPPGALAVAMLASPAGSRDLPSGFPLVSDAPDYYSAALSLLARVAWRETRR